MTLSVDSITPLGFGAWRFAWTDTDGAPYHVVLDGTEIAQTDALSYDWHSPGYNTYPPPLEIVEDGQEAESQRHPPFVRIEWEAVPGAAGYGVERFVAGQWTRAGSVHDAGQPAYSYQTGKLEAGTVVVLRVSAEDAFGNPAATLAYSRSVVCCPPPPDASVAVSYAPGFVTIAEA